MQGILMCVSHHLHWVLVSSGGVTSILGDFQFRPALSFFLPSSFIHIHSGCLAGAHNSENIFRTGISFFSYCFINNSETALTSRLKSCDSRDIKFGLKCEVCVCGLRLCVWWQDCHAVITGISLSLLLLLFLLVLLFPSLLLLLTTA